MAVQSSYTVLILPLRSGLHTWEAMNFFLWLKQMKDLEQERDSLLQGLDLVERARAWYHQRLRESQDHQQTLGTSTTRCFKDPYSNYGCLLLARIQEVNVCLGNLLSAPGQAAEPPAECFSSPTARTAFHPQTLSALREHNHLLLKEVTEKSDRIAALEKEKAALCQQLQEIRIYRAPSHKESTFI